MVLAVALGLSTTASAPVPAFFVDASVRAGSSPQLAGSLLAAASAAAILTRLVGGAVADRLPRGHLILCATLIAGGSVGLALLAVGTPGAMAVGVIVALMAIWGFIGVFVFAVMRAYPDAPGAATGATMPGGLIGGIVGPVAFGAIAEAFSYPAAWGFVCAAAVAAVGGFTLASRRLARMEAPR